MPLSHLEPVQRRTVAILGREGTCAHVEHVQLRPPDTRGYYRIGLPGVVAFVNILTTDDAVVEFARELLRSRVERLMDKAGAS